MRLFHFSEDPGIARFEPRASAYTEGPVVWAIGEDRAANYLLPRECPRVCVRATAGGTLSWFPRLRGGRLLTMRATETAEFREALMVSPSNHAGRAPEAIVAVEAGWMERIRAATLYRYDMPPAPYRLIDEGAGYWVADESVTPLAVSVSRQSSAVGPLFSKYARHLLVSAPRRS